LRTMALVASVCAVTACGQKGPLYLAPATTAAPAAAAPQPAKAAQDSKTKPADATVSAPAR
jgi:predicted small lipoprotein YifL